jgi:hypothetical protein
MEQHKRPWPSHLIVVQPDPEPELTGKERRFLEADVRYWRESSKRKDKEIEYRDNQIRGLKGHITRLHAQLHKKGVYKS